MRNARVLVTGAAGFIGSQLLARLRAGGWQCVGVDSADFDVREVGAFTKAVRTCAPSTVVHAAAVSGSDAAASDPGLALDVNVGGTAAALTACRACPGTRLILLSSIAAYGDQHDRTPVREDCELRATDAYGASKRAAEAVAYAYRCSGSVSTVALRIASVYGPRRQAPCRIRDLVNAASKGECFATSAGDRNFRQFIHVADVVDAIVATIDAADWPHAAYNVATGDYTSEPDLVEEALALGFPLVSVVDPARTVEFDGHLGPLDPSAIQADFGFTASIRLREGIAAMLSPDGARQAAVQARD